MFRVQLLDLIKVIFCNYFTLDNKMSIYNGKKEFMTRDLSERVLLWLNRNWRKIFDRHCQCRTTCGVQYMKTWKVPFICQVETKLPTISIFLFNQRVSRFAHNMLFFPEFSAVCWENYSGMLRGLNWIPTNLSTSFDFSPMYYTSMRSP